MADALSDIRILDLSEGIAGPYATSLLGDLGAEVIKIERIEGEWGRFAGRSVADGLGAMYVAMNRNKRVLSLDLKHDRARAIVRGLVPDSDVVVSNSRPGAMRRLGLDADSCRALRPDLVYCAISAFDTTGPYAQLGGNDTGLQAVSGFMSLNGEASGEPLRAGIPVIDMIAAMFVSQAILAALRTPPESPERVLDVSLLNAAAALQTLAFTEYLNTGQAPGRHGNQNPFIAPAGAFAGSDGRYFTIACLKESHWRQLCAVVDRSELVADPRYDGNELRVRHRDELSAELARLFATRPAGDWVQLLQEHGVLCAVVNDVPAVVGDPGLGDTLPIVDDGTVRTLGHPVRFGGEFPVPREPPTVNGAHTRELLAEQGLDAAAIEALLRDGVAYAPPAPAPVAARSR